MKLNLAFFLLVVSFHFASSQNRNLSNGNVFDGEPYLAINPNNSEHQVVAWMGWAGVGNGLKIQVKASFDSGATWSDAYELPHVNTAFTSADCSIAFDSSGDVYISYIDFTGRDTDPLEGGIYLCKSVDGGLTFGSPSEVLNINQDPDRLPIDRPWIAIDGSLGAHDGTIYVTSMNAEGADPDFHPYVSISTDGGDTFLWKELDGVNWLSGNDIPLPMPTPIVSTSGVFHAIYPSYVPSQNVFPQFVHTASTDGGTSFSYSSVFASLTSASTDPLPKKGYLLRANPANPLQLVFVYLSNVNGDLDVFVRLSSDAGTTWSDEIRVNDDPIGNDVMQDLVWADFDSNGDLIVCWRDRRNGASGTYETASEIWSAFLAAGETNFAPNFQLTDQLVDYNTVLASAGNDFMSVQLDNGIVYATWGDPRNNTLSIWYQKSLTDGTILGLQELSSQTVPKVIVFPSPSTAMVTIKFPSIQSYTLFDNIGKMIISEKSLNPTDQVQLDMQSYDAGVYYVEVNNETSTSITKIVKN